MTAHSPSSDSLLGRVADVVHYAASGCILGSCVTNILFSPREALLWVGGGIGAALYLAAVRWVKLI